GHPALVPNKEVDAEQLLSFFGSHREDFNFPSPLQAQIYVQNYLSVEEDLTEFAGSLLVDPDEYGTENAALFLPNDQSSPRSSRKAYAEDSSDRTTYHAYRE
ncbi:hypothetical protein H0E87_020622, partial [Populus deltoides]